MAVRHEIKCINKTNRTDPHARIQAIGGQNADGTLWKLTQEQAIAGIEDRKWEFYVQVNGHPVNVIVAVSRFSHKYIKTVADGEQPNNLLSLRECLQ